MFLQIYVLDTVALAVAIVHWTITRGQKIHGCGTRRGSDKMIISWPRSEPALLVPLSQQEKIAL